MKALACEHINKRNLKMCVKHPRTSYFDMALQKMQILKGNDKF